MAREGLRVLNAMLPEGLTINAMPFSLSQVASGRVLPFDDPDKMDQSRHDTRRQSSLKGGSEITKVLRLKYGPYLATSILSEQSLGYEIES